MQRARRLLLLLLLLLRAPAAGAAGGGAELDVVIPERVGLEKIHLLEPAGEARRGSLRRPRALPLPLPRSEEEEEEAAVLLLRLPTSGSELYVHLRRDPRFLAPGFAVEEWGKPGLARSRPPELPDCFYTGHVLNRTDSFASLSTCAGLIGYIQVGSEHLLIQPVNISETSFSGKEHFIRRKRSSKSSPPVRLRGPDEHCRVVSEKKRQKKIKSVNDWRERRNAIRLTNEYTVETLVVADANMVQYHGAEAAQRFILTVMNMIQIFVYGSAS